MKCVKRLWVRSFKLFTLCIFMLNTASFAHEKPMITIGVSVSQTGSVASLGLPQARSL